MRIIFQSKFSGMRKRLDFPNDITVGELKYGYLGKIGFDPGCLLFYKHDGILEDNKKISTYGIEDGDTIFVEDELEMEKKFFEREHKFIAVYRKNSTHTCPYGCGRQIPDKYKGCSELLQAEPNYFG